MSKRQRIARIHAAMMDAQEALAGTDPARLERAADELLAAMIDEPGAASELGARELRARVVARRAELVLAALRRTLTPCPCCRGTELLVSTKPERAALDGLDLKVTLIVCRSCGDLRMQCADPAALAERLGPGERKLFRPITLPSRDAGPFR